MRRTTERRRVMHRIASLLFFSILSTGLAVSQIPGSSARLLPPEAETRDGRVTQVINKSEDHFRKGKLYLDENKRERARDEFDKAVDSILVAGIDVRENPRLLRFYVELVDRVYQLEILQRSVRNQSSSSLTLIEPRDNDIVGFREQKYEPSPMDQMAKLVLTPDGVATEGEPSCALTSSRDQNLRGLYLGMPVADVQKHLTGVRAYSSAPSHVDEFGSWSLTFITTKSNRKQIADFSDVSKIVLEFLDNRLSRIELSYDGSITWNSPAEFLERVSKSLKLPLIWIKNRHSEYYMTCNGFLVKATNFRSLASVALIDTNALKLIQQRSLARDERRRQTFKP